MNEAELLLMQIHVTFEIIIVRLGLLYYLSLLYLNVFDVKAAFVDVPRIRVRSGRCLNVEQEMTYNIFRVEAYTVGMIRDKQCHYTQSDCHPNSDATETLHWYRVLVSINSV